MTATRRLNFGWSWTLVLAIAVAVISANSIFVPSLSYIARDLGATEAVAASNMSISRLVMIVMMFSFGAFANLFTSRRLLQTALALAVVSCLLSATAVNFAMFNLAQAIEGAARAMTIITVQLWIAGVSDNSNLTTRLSWYSIIITIAPIGAPAVGGLVADHLSWHWSFGLLAMVLMLLLVALTAGRIAEAEPTGERFDLLQRCRDYKQVIIRSPLLSLTASVGWMAWVDGAYMAITSFLFVDQLGLNASSLGMIILTYVGGAFAGRFPVMWLQKHCQPRTTFIFHQTIVLLATASGAAWYFITGGHTILEITIVMVLFGLGFSGMYIYSLSNSMIIDSAHKSIYSSVFNTTYSVASLLGVLAIQGLYLLGCDSVQVFETVLCVATAGMLLCIPLHLNSLKLLVNK